MALRNGHNRLNFDVLIEYPVAEYVSVIEEGTPLVTIIEDGVAKVQPSSGSSTEQFIGAAFNIYQLPSQFNGFLTASVPTAAPYSVELSRIALSPSTSILVKRKSDGVVFAFHATTPADGVYTVATVGNKSVITFHSANAGQEFDIVFKYALLVEEARQLVGDGTPGINNTAILKSTGVITQGTIITSNFDTGSDWSNSSLPVRLGANGTFTKNGTGAVIQGCFVTQVPDDSGFLGLYFNA